MTLNEFIRLYDNENVIVLLEGKRNVLDQDKENLRKIGELLASKAQKMSFRSGNAKGSDQFFSEGVAAVNKSRLEVIVPYTGHRKKTSQAYKTHSLDEINISNDPEVIYQSKQNEKTKSLVDKYISGDRNQYAIKAAYIIRDTIKAIGTEGISPATFGIFYDDLTNPLTGGTGHTMKVCMENNIPVINQTVWFKWLEE